MYELSDIRQISRKGKKRGEAFFPIYCCRAYYVYFAWNMGCGESLAALEYF